MPKDTKRPSTPIVDKAPSQKADPNFPNSLEEANEALKMLWSIIGARTVDIPEEKIQELMASAFVSSPIDYLNWKDPNEASTETTKTTPAAEEDTKPVAFYPLAIEGPDAELTLKEIYPHPILPKTPNDSPSAEQQERFRLFREQQDKRVNEYAKRNSSRKMP